MHGTFGDVAIVPTHLVMFCSVALLHNALMFMGSAEKHKEAEDPEYVQEVICKIHGYHERMKKIVIDRKENGDKPADMVFTSVSFAGGGFRTISYAPSVFYLYESKRIDENTTYHGKHTRI